MRILYFNPETEYALATGASFYTPPAIIKQFKDQNCLLPESYAREGDCILVDDVSLIPARSAIMVPVVGWSDLSGLSSGDISGLSSGDISIRPWGWNHALLRRFNDSGVPAHLLPSASDIDNIRSLSHRRTTISLNCEWNSLCPDDSLKVPLPVELTGVDSCIEFWNDHPDCWMKAPWSSSGRGVINTAADLEERHIRPWCAGIIRRQGSVVAELNAPKVADFASEWILRDGVAHYIGLSMFETSRRGKYLENYDIGQEEMLSRFDSLSSLPFTEVKELQKTILENVFKGYDGPLGVDMMVCNDGSLRPFLEVNLRITMGMIRLESAKALL